MTPLPPDTMLAWGGRGSIGVRSAPVYRAPMATGRTYTPSLMPRQRPGMYYHVPRSSYGRYPFGYIGGGPYYGWGYGGPMYWGTGYAWDNRAYAWSRADAQRLSLQSGKPPGTRMTGFLYFPRIDAGGHRIGAAVHGLARARADRCSAPLSYRLRYEQTSRTASPAARRLGLALLVLPTLLPRAGLRQPPAMTATLLRCG